MDTLLLTSRQLLTVTDAFILQKKTKPLDIWGWFPFKILWRKNWFLAEIGLQEASLQHCAKINVIISLRHNYSKCGPCTSDINITWEMVENARSLAPPQIPKSKSLGVWPRYLGLTRLSGDSFTNQDMSGPEAASTRCARYVQGVKDRVWGWCCGKDPALWVRKRKRKGKGVTKDVTQ